MLDDAGTPVIIDFESCRSTAGDKMGSEKQTRGWTRMTTDSEAGPARVMSREEATMDMDTYAISLIEEFILNSRA
jgi:hypothetical protein